MLRTIFSAACVSAAGCVWPTERTVPNPRMTGPVARIGLAYMLRSVWIEGALAAEMLSHRSED